VSFKNFTGHGLAPPRRRANIVGRAVPASFVVLDPDNSSIPEPLSCRCKPEESRGFSLLPVYLETKGKLAWAAEGIAQVVPRRAVGKRNQRKSVEHAPAVTTLVPSDGNVRVGVNSDPEKKRSALMDIPAPVKGSPGCSPRQPRACAGTGNARPFANTNESVAFPRWEVFPSGSDSRQAFPEPRRTWRDNSPPIRSPQQARPIAKGRGQRIRSRGQKPGTLRSRRPSTPPVRFMAPRCLLLQGQGQGTSKTRRSTASPSAGGLRTPSRPLV
jgi:hypothetical protein